MMLLLETVVIVLMCLSYGKTARSPDYEPLTVLPMAYQKMYQFYGGTDYKIFGAGNSRYQAVLESLPDSIRKALVSNDTTNNQVTESDLRQLDTNTIAMLQKDLLRVLKDSQIISIGRNFQSIQRYREAAKVLERLGYGLNNQQIMQLISSIDYNKRCSKDIQTMIRQGLRFIDSPEQWNPRTLELLGNVVTVSLPAAMLMQIENSAVALTLVNRLTGAMDGSFGCGMSGVSSSSGADPSDQIVHIHRVQLKLLATAYGHRNHWNEDILRSNQQLLSSLTIQSLQTIRPSVLKAVLPVLSQISTWDSAQGYCIVRRVCEYMGSSFSIINPDQFSAFLENLGKLAPYFLPQYLPKNLNSTQSSLLISAWADSLNNFLLRGIALPRRTYRAFVYYRLTQLDVATISKQNLFSLGPSTGFLKVAPWKLLDQAKKLDYVDRATLQRLAIDESGGYLRDGDVARFNLLANGLFRNSGRLDFYTIPSVFLSGISSKDITAATPAEVQSAVQRLAAATSATSLFTTGQIAAAVSKLGEGGYDLSTLNMGPVLKSCLVFSNLTTLTISQLKNLVADMPADSFLRLHYAATKTANYNITVEDLKNDPLLVPQLNATQVNYINLNDTPALLAAVRSAAQGPSIQTERVLQTRLKNYTRVRRLDIDDNDGSMLENAWLTNFDIYPATALAGFSTETLENVSPARKVEILRAMGNLPMADYYTIPRAKRFTIIKQGLYAINKDNGDLNDADLVLLGNAVFDISRRDIQRLNFRAFEYALPLLQGDIDIFSGLSARPCLNADQRAGVRQAIKEAYGELESWDVDTMAVVCCSLDTLTVDELNDIRDDVIIECDCSVDSEPPLHLRYLSQAMKLACLTELGPELGGLRAGKQNVKTRRATAALKLFQDNTTIIVGIFDTKNKPEKRKSLVLNCDAVINSGSGASGFTPQQLETLPAGQIQYCIYDLGSNYLSNEQAKIIWTKIKSAYGGVPNVPEVVLKQLGYILRGVDPDSIKQMNLNNPDVIATFGTSRDLSKDQLAALASGVLASWKKPYTFSGQDLYIMGSLICGMAAADIQQIPVNSYLVASPLIGQIENCDPEVLSALASLAKNSRVFQNPSSWNASAVRIIGCVIGGLGADELRSVPASSMTGLTPTAVRCITPNNFKALLTDQIKNFPLAAAQAVTREQRTAMIPEMVNALEFVMWGPDGKSLGNPIKFSLSLALLSILVSFIV